MGICAEPQPRPCALGDDLRCGTPNGGKQPIETGLPRDEFDSPRASLVDEFIVSFGNPEYFVDRFDPFCGHHLLVYHGRERQSD